MTNSPVLTILLPTYNEAGNIIELIKALKTTLARLDQSHEILVIDDNSPDGTPDLIRQTFGRDVRLYVRKNERGLASALRFGVQQALGEFLLIMDSDFNHKPEDVPRLFECRDRADLVIGSRYTKGGGMPHSKIRHFLSYCFNLFVRTGLSLPVKDSLSGFVCIRTSLLRQLPVSEIFTGYGDFCIRLLYIAQRSGLRIVEVPVKYGTRLSGTSKTRFIYHPIQYAKVVFELRSTEIAPLPAKVLAAAASQAANVSATPK